MSSVQQCFVIMAGVLAARSRRVVVCVLADLLEGIELLLLVVREVGKVALRILHALNAL
jgi:hypothetical protein|tara:strand:+ start:2636 stop:2812 length:177 start_codon:yes stop_codon:yes gene_type:complete